MKITPANIQLTNIPHRTFTSGNKNDTMSSRPMTPASFDEFVSADKLPETFVDRCKKFLERKKSPEALAVEYLNNVIAYRNRMIPEKKLAYFSDLPAHPEDFNGYINNIKDVIYVPERKYQFGRYDLCCFASKPDILNTIVQNNLHKQIKGRKAEFNSAELEKLGSVTENNYPLMMKYGLFADIKGRPNPLNSNELIQLSNSISKYKDKISPKTFHNIKDRQLLVSKFDSGNYLPAEYIIPLALLSNADWRNIKNNGALKYHNMFEPDVIPDIAKMSADKIAKIVPLKNIVDIWISRANLSKLFSMSDAQFDTAEKFVKDSYTFKDIETLLYCTTYSSDIVDKFNSAKEIAARKKDLIFKDYDCVPKDSIDDMFEDYSLSIHEFLDILGLKPFTYLCSEGYDNMTDLFSAIQTPLDSAGTFYTLEQHKELKKRLSDNSLSPEEKLLKYRAVLAMPTVPLKDKLINLINTNSPSKEQILTAKKIWSDSGKTFDAKMLEFNENFGTAGNKRVQAFFENRANVINGRKNLTAVDSKELAYLIMNEVNKKNNDKLFNKALNEVLYDEYLKISSDSKLPEKVNFINSPYLSKLLLSDRRTFDEILGMLKYLDSYPDISVKEAFDKLPQNKVTKDLFEKHGLNYDRWVTPDDDLAVTVNTELNKKRAEMKVLQSLEEDFTSINFRVIPETERLKIFNALEKIGISIKQEEIFDIAEDEALMKITETRLYKNGSRIKYDDLKDILAVVNPLLEKEPFWHEKIENSMIRSSRDNFYYHMTQMRPKEIADIDKMQGRKNTVLSVRQVDMNDIEHSLFLGNHAACCTAIGSSSDSNSYAAPRYVMDKFISALEVLDGDKPVGNTMCYFVLLHGKPALVLDNIELQGKYQNIDLIRDAIIETASKLAAAVGSNDISIYAAPLRHKVSMDKFKAHPVSFTVLGSTNSCKTYLDFIGETYVLPELRFDTNLYKLR